MKAPKIVNAMNYIDDNTIAAANKQPAVMKKPLWTKWVAVAAAFMLVFGGVVLALQLGGQAGAVDAIVALDVNPSIELEIDKDENVISAKALNADAEKVLAGMDLKDVDIDVAVNAIIGSMLKNGYLTVDRNSILVSVNSENTQRASELQSSIAGSIESILSASNIDASVLSQSYQKNEAVEQIAKENNISEAKATLIEKIVAFGLTDHTGVPYTYETLAAMRVHELKMLLDSKKVEVEGVNTSGTANNSAYIGADKALEIALTEAGLGKDAVKNIEIELDYEHGVMVYGVEFDTLATEYEYEIDAKTGEILEREQEPHDDDDDHDDHDDRDHDHDHDD